MKNSEQFFSSVIESARTIDSKLSEWYQAIAFSEFEKTIKKEAKLNPSTMLEYMGEKKKMLEESKFAIASLDDSQKGTLIHILKTRGTKKAFVYVKSCLGTKPHLRYMETFQLR